MWHFSSLSVLLAFLFLSAEGAHQPRRLRPAAKQLRPHIGLTFGSKTERKKNLKCWHKCHSKCALKCSRFASWPSCDRATVPCKMKLAAHYNKFEGCVKLACKECYEFCHTLGNDIELSKASAEKPPALR